MKNTNNNFVNAIDELLTTFEELQYSYDKSIEILEKLSLGENVVDVVLDLRKVGYTNSEANYLIDKYWTENDIKIDRKKYLTEYIKEFKDAKNNKLN